MDVDKMKMPVISFEMSASKEVLKSLGIYRNSEGFLVKCGDYIIAFDDGKPIHYTEFGGMWRGKDGQTIYFKSDLPSLIEALEAMRHQIK